MQKGDRLDDYRDKRDFSRTGEPAGDEERRPAGDRPAFVVQKHDARRLHYDFRLEWNGALWSWAVTRGPSACPKDRRLAVRTEDHPLDYGDFEGTIPEDQYGGGTVMLWDRGWWEPLEDPEAGIEKGKLHFRLHGERMTGGWALVRMKARGGEKRENWLLVKDDDAHARNDGDALTRKNTDSVKSGRSMEEIAAAGDTVLGMRISHPERVLFADQGIAKIDLARYYAAVAGRMLEDAADHPVSLVRCPQGARKSCFFQKHAGDGFPEEIRTVPIQEKSGKRADYLYIHDGAGLVAAVQMGTLEFHIWGSAVDRIEKPDRMVFDLDPDEGLDFARVRQAAAMLRDRLADLGLNAVPMVTGGKGVHVVVPLERRADWSAVKAFAKGFASQVADADPERYVATMSRQKRKGRIFIDWLRNERGATAIAPYSTRSRPGGPVATPVSWSELEDLDAANGFRIPDILERLEKKDPWQESRSWRQSVTRKMRAAVGA